MIAKSYCILNSETTAYTSVLNRSLTEDKLPAAVLISKIASFQLAHSKNGAIVEEECFCCNISNAFLLYEQASINTPEIINCAPSTHVIFTECKVSSYTVLGF